MYNSTTIGDTQRFCLLTSRLPFHIRAGGSDWMIDTRAAVAIDCLVAFQDTSIPEEVKPAYACSRLILVDALNSFPANLIGEAFGACNKYLSGPPELAPSNPQSKTVIKPVMDYIQDAEAIVASFWHAYGLTLEQTTNLHWWIFMALLKNIPSDTTFSRIVNLRAKRLPANASIEEKHELAAVQAKVVIKDRRTPEQKRRDAQESINALDL